MFPSREENLSKRPEHENGRSERVCWISSAETRANISISLLAFSFHPRQSSFPRVPFFAGSFTHMYIPPLSISFPGNRRSLIKTTSVRSKSFRLINPEMNRGVIGSVIIRYSSDSNGRSAIWICLHNNFKVNLQGEM